MNTGFLNRSRALVIGQALCLLAIAAVFFAVPFVAMAGKCGGGGNNAQDDANNAIKKSAKQTTNIKILAIIKQIDPVIAPRAINASTLDPKHLPAGATMDGSIELIPYTQQALKVGDWVLIRQVQPTGASVTYPATIFGDKKINGVEILETWPAETPVLLPQNSNVATIPVGKKLFVTLPNFTSNVATS
jgi:hypothetical protein